MGRRRKIVAQIGVHKTTLAALARIAKKETDGELISALEKIVTEAADARRFADRSGLGTMSGDGIFQGFESSEKSHVVFADSGAAELRHDGFVSLTPRFLVYLRYQNEAELRRDFFRAVWRFYHESVGRVFRGRK